MKFKNTMLGLALSVSAFTAGCSSSSSAPGDAVSRKNALEAAAGGGTAAIGANSNGGNSLEILANEVFSGSTNCKNGGSVKVSGEATESESTISMSLTAEMNNCEHDDDGKATGKVTISVTGGAASFAVKMNGNVTAHAKNKDGKLATHKMELKDLTFTLTMSENPEFEFASTVDCTGSIVIDGEAKTCNQIMTEGASPQAPQEPGVGAFNGTSVYRHTEDEQSLGYVAIERNGKFLDQVLSVTATNDEGEDYAVTPQYLPIVFLHEEGQSLLTDTFSKAYGTAIGLEVAAGLSPYSEAGFAILFDSAHPEFFSASSITITVLFSDDSTETITRDL